MNLEFDHIFPVLEKYGNAFSCDFLLGNYPVLKINKNLKSEEVKKFRDQIQDSPTIEISCKLDKSELVSNIYEFVEGKKIFFYFFYEALERFLKVEITEIERQIWGDRLAYKAFIIVAD